MVPVLTRQTPVYRYELDGLFSCVSNTSWLRRRFFIGCLVSALQAENAYVWAFTQASSPGFNIAGLQPSKTSPFPSSRFHD